jgi:hypothetical protein
LFKSPPFLNFAKLFDVGLMRRQGIWTGFKIVENVSLDE